MKILLTAINAKYIHSNPAVVDLKAYAESAGLAPDTTIHVATYTINQPKDQTLRDIYAATPDVLIFSCYIWNITLVTSLVGDMAALRPDLPIWLGGPEVSYECEETLACLPGVTGIMIGEGELIFHRLVQAYENGAPLTSVPGIIFRGNDGTPVRTGTLGKNGQATAFDLSDLPFPYENVSADSHRIYYYESSRGCPFSCSYCLSSVDKHLRFRDLTQVFRDLDRFLEARVPQVKFIDRTFNAGKAHAMAIWQYILEHDNGVTNFHFEAAADLIDEAMLALFARMRPGLIQLEIGVQSTNPDTLATIRRVMDFDKVSAVVQKINALGNIHQHLDLIAGLPFEDYTRFGQSFDEVFALAPAQLQLGFLKVLKGSYMFDHRGDYGLIYTADAPYEVLRTKWLTFDDVIRLKGIEDMVERFYNSHQFDNAVTYLLRFFDRPFTFFEALAAFFDTHTQPGAALSRAALCAVLLDFAKENVPEAAAGLQTLLIFDIYLREKAKSRPAFAEDVAAHKSLISEKARSLWENESASDAQSDHPAVSYKQFLHDTHQEVFACDPEELLSSGQIVPCRGVYHFDYRKRDPLTYNAAVRVI
ncbi:MAG: B12-binding domain-containing radical SAM protein [Lachnospiraceae bacterium]|nr:B12-binding domain-containing radical SAM protein [Lachnospiraceae bacterium]